MLGKEDIENVRSYTDMLGSMLGSVGGLDDLDDLDQ
jgi:magnesium chelatase subunit I